jgi:diguanylate cyclase
MPWPAEGGKFQVMDAPTGEHERTLAFAEIALGQIRALRQPATPRSFEIWYAYATGHNPSLNEAINEIVNRDGTLTVADADHIYHNYISTSRFADRTDQLGDQMIGKIEQIMATIGAAAGDTSDYSRHLEKFGQELGRAADSTGIRTIVQGLVHATKHMEENNKALEQRLSASKTEITQLQGSLNTVRKESLTDSLTSLANRKYFDEALPKAIAAAGGQIEPLSLLMLDIDHFKKFNDNHGHLTGDEVLRLVAGTIKQNVKGQDLAARYGGEEFAVVLPNTPLRSAVTVADHIRRAIMAKELVKRSTGEHLGRVTITIGVATLQPGDDPQSLIERADNCLYAAKRGGRNRVSSEADPEPAMDATTKVA